MKNNNGCIIKIKKKSNFTVVSNTLPNDRRLSCKAKGIMIYLLSKPEDWETNIEDIYKHMNDGYSSIRSGISELILTGYMELRNTLDQTKGLFTGRYYVVFEEPLFLEGYRKLENKNRGFRPDEEIVLENPLGNKKVFKVNKESEDLP